MDTHDDKICSLARFDRLDGVPTVYQSYHSLDLTADLNTRYMDTIVTVQLL
jgi:hypothetical protein